VLPFASPGTPSPVDYLRHPIPDAKGGSPRHAPTLGLANCEEVAASCSCDPSEGSTAIGESIPRLMILRGISPFGVRGSTDESTLVAER